MLHHAVFSDTILVWSGVAGHNDRDPGFGSTFFMHLARLFGEAIQRDLPLRMGVAFGECCIHQSRGIYVGQPMVDAYLTEQAQDWVSAACHPSCESAPHFANLRLLARKQAGPLVEYEIPCKPMSGQRLNLALDWPFPMSPAGFVNREEQQAEALVRQFAANRGTSFEPRWSRAIEFYRSRMSRWGDARERFDALVMTISRCC